MTSPDDLARAEAEKLLPCEIDCNDPMNTNLDARENHFEHCPAHYREPVAQALAALMVERDSAQNKFTSHTKAVQVFLGELSEIYSLELTDETPVKDGCAAIIKAATDARQGYEDLITARDAEWNKALEAAAADAQYQLHFTIEMFKLNPVEWTAYHLCQLEKIKHNLGNIRALRRTDAPDNTEMPDDVVRLVIAARAIAFGDQPAEADTIRELDQASEAFASRIPWEDEPDEEEAGCADDKLPGTADQWRDGIKDHIADAENMVPDGLVNMREALEIASITPTIEELRAKVVEAPGMHTYPICNDPTCQFQKEGTVHGHLQSKERDLG